MEGLSVFADRDTDLAPEPFGHDLVDLYRSYAGDLLEMLWVFVGDRATAEDIVQESFVRLHGARGRIERADGGRAYLRSVAFNLARSGFRRRAVGAASPPGAGSTGGVAGARRPALRRPA